MTKQEQLRYEYFIETGIVWIDTNDNIEMDYLKWVENKALNIPVVVGQSEQLCDECEEVKVKEQGLLCADCLFE
jgi:hypothetical protein